MRRFRDLLLLGLVMTGLLSASACSAGRTGTPASAPAAQKALPNLVGSPLSAVAQAVGSSKLLVIVRFPAASATYSVDATRVAGRLVPAHTAEASVPERVLSLKSALPSTEATPTRVVTAQTPAAGIPLSGVATLTLTAGPHQWETTIPWVVAHAAYVARNGLTPCLGCHSPKTCAQCHVRLDLPKG
jgi:hypothetical protein